MKMRKANHPMIIAIAAVLVSALATTAIPASKDGSGKDGRDGNNKGRQNADELWLDRENGCAVGNNPPPGANCTNRETD